MSAGFSALVCGGTPTLEPALVHAALDAFRAKQGVTVITVIRAAGKRAEEHVGPVVEAWAGRVGLPTAAWPRPRSPRADVRTAGELRYGAYAALLRQCRPHGVLYFDGADWDLIPPAKHFGVPVWYADVRDRVLRRAR